MNHNLNLNDEAAEVIRRAVAEIFASFRTWHDGLDERVARIMPTDDYLHIGALFGTIHDAAYRIDAIVFDTDPDDEDYGIERDLSAAKRRHPTSQEALIQRALSLVVAATPDDEHIERDPAGRIALCDDDCTCRGLGSNGAHAWTEPGVPG